MIKKQARIVVYIFLVIFMTTTFYLIFNAGNPGSLVRYVIKDTSYDILLTVVSGALIVVCVLILGFGRNDKDPIILTLESNRQHVDTLRKKGTPDDDIAVSFVNELKIKSGVMRSLILKKVRRHLKRME